MKKPNWFQRIFTREPTTKEVVGKITDRQYAARGIAHQPVTLYAVTDEERTVYRGAILGHQTSPNLGDRVDVCLETGNVLVRQETQIQKSNSDGSVEIVPQEIVWEAIKQYKVLEQLV